MKKITVIIPVYNVEKYLRECIESLVNQRLEGKEIIFINDGSTDDSLNILKEYQKKYKEIIIINQKNLGQSVARNRGIKESTGKYIMFLDSDDWLEDGCLEKLYKMINKTNYDFINFSMFNFYPITKKKIEKKYSFIDDLEEDKILENFFQRKIITSSVNKIIKSKLLKENKINFPEGLIYEDLIFNLKLCYFSKKTKYEDYSFYNYRLTPVSTTRKITKKNINEMKKILEVGKKFLKEKRNQEKNEYNNFELYHYLYLAIEIIRNKNINMKEKVILLKFLFEKDKLNWELKNIKMLPNKYKYVYLFIKILKFFLRT